MSKVLYLFSEGFKNVWRHKMTALTAILSLFISLYIIGALATAGDNTHKVLHYLRSKYKVEVFFAQDISNEQAVGLIHKIKKIEGVRTATIIEKEDAVRIFKDQFGEDIVELLGYNPLPVSAVVNIDRSRRDRLRIEPIIKDSNNVAPKYSEIPFKFRYPKKLATNIESIATGPTARCLEVPKKA